MQRVQPSQAYLVTTTGGTRIVLDLRGAEWLWLRDPTFRPDGRLNLVQSDGTWQRLAWTAPVDAEPTWSPGVDVLVGTSLVIYDGAFNEAWRTSPVVSIEPVEDLALETF